jgi:hypothetical protein
MSKVWQTNEVVDVNAVNRWEKFTNWDEAIPYVTNDVSISAGLVYTALQNGTNKIPASNPTYWRVWNNVEMGAYIFALTGKTTPLDADSIGISDSAASNVGKKVTLTNFKAFLKTYFDTLYNKYVHPNHSGDVTSVADGANTIAAKAVTLAKMNDLAANTIIGRVTASTGVPEALTAANIRTIINVADGANAYVHPNHSGDVTSVADGANTIVSGAVTLAKMANMATGSLIYRRTAGAGAPEVNTLAQLKTDLNIIVPYVYTCTGTADDVAITDLVNAFLGATGAWNATTALTMKLVISGTVGLSATPAYGAGTVGDIYRHFNFSSTQSRNAVVHIDWSDARGLQVDTTVSGQYRAMIYHVGAGSTVYHHNLSTVVTITNGSGYGVYHNGTGSMYIINSNISGRQAIYNRSSGTMKVYDSKLLGNTWSAYGSVYNYSTGTIIINNCYCWNNIQNYSTGFIYMENSEFYWSGVAGSGISNSVGGEVHVSNCYISIISSNDDIFAIVNYNVGTIFISNCYIKAECTGPNICMGVRNASSGSVHVSNCQIITICSNVTVVDNVTAGVYQDAGAGKLFVSNCRITAHKHTTNTSGTAYGIWVNTSDTGCMIRLTNNYFPLVTISDRTQSGAFYSIGTAGTVKFVIIGNIFHTATIHIDAADIASITAASGKYFPQYSNQFSVT